jgi:uncharacterized protein (TIGR02001 family)
MKKCSVGLFIAFALVGGIPVHTEENSHQISGNVSVMTDYLYRGISQTREKMALQGELDYAHLPTGFYAGTWASNVDFAENVEMNIYSGIGGVSENGLVWDVGGLYYLYPGSNEEPEENFFEAYTNLAYTFSNVLLEPGIVAGLAWTPDFFGEDGDGVYVYASLELSLPQEFDLSFYAGHQDVQGGKLSGSTGFNYTHYRVGLSRGFGPLDLSVSWNDADDDCDGSTDELCQAVVFSVGTSF